MMNLKSRLKRIERHTPELKHPPRGSTMTDRLLSMLTGIQLRVDPSIQDATPGNVSPLVYAEAQHTMALAEQRWVDAERWDAEAEQHIPAEVKADPLRGRLTWIRERHIAACRP